MNNLSSPSTSATGGEKSSSTPTMLRAKNTSRRISVWMQQTWRERSIPSADFSAQSSSGSPTRTPIRKTNTNATTTPPNPTSSGNPSTVVAGNSEETLVANVDEAFGAWTSLYKFQDYFSEVDVPQEDDDVVDRSVDWILDGHHETWEQDCKRSQELLKTMYPEDSTNMFAELLHLEDNVDTFQRQTDTNDKPMDQESLLLLKFGSSMGQQEYQFASFETANFSNGATNDVKPSTSDEPEIVDENETQPAEDSSKILQVDRQPSSEEPQPNMKLLSSPTRSNDSDFETFWQSAIEAPTPETGTFTSIGSRSTYALSPLPDSDGLFSPPIGTFRANNTAALDCIYSQEENEDNDDDDDDITSGSDFGDFQDGNARAVAEDPNSAETNDKSRQVASEPKDASNDTGQPKTISSPETAFTPLPNQEVSPVMHTGVTPLQKNGRYNTPTPELQNASPVPVHSTDNGEFETPLSNRDFVTQSDETDRLEKPSVSAAHTQNPEDTPITEQFTPVTRNFRYWESNEDDSGESFNQPRARTILMVPGNQAANNRKFRLEDTENPDEDSDIDENEMDSATEEEEEDESLFDESIQSSSIPSVVQLFTKSVDADRRSKIVVPNTVRATRNQTLTASTGPVSNNGLAMPSFYFGRNQTRRPSSEILSVSASEVASASASILSMPMMKNSLRRVRTSTNKPHEETVDEPSINSSLASPEVKFLRRNKGKHANRSRMGGNRASSLSLQSRTSRTSEGLDDGTLDDSKPQPYGDSDFHLGDSDNDSDEFNDEESLSIGSLSTLPNEYWKHPKLDHTLQELKRLEWDWLPYWQMDRLLDDVGVESGFSTDNIPLLQDQITQNLSRLDSFYGKICKQLYRKIQPHSETLLSANQAAMDLYQNLQLSQMYLSRSQESMDLARYGKVRREEENEERNDDEKDEGREGVGVHGALQLLELWDTQQSYDELCRVEEAISEISNLDTAISERIQCFDTYNENALENYDNLLGMVTSIGNKLNAAPANRLVCLDSMRERSRTWISKALVTRLHDCLSEIAVDWCLATNSSEATLYVADGPSYSRLIEILFRIDGQAGKSEINPPTPTASSNPVMAICTTIQTCLLMEIQKAFGKALLDPTDSEKEESEYEQELAALASNESYLDASRLPIWTHNLVTIRFEFEMKQGGKQSLPAIFHKLCLLLTNILCGMHRLIEWHGKDRVTKKSAEDLMGVSACTKIAIRDELRARRASIWNACIQSIEECLEEFLNHSGKKKLFSKHDETQDDSCWRRDLEGLHDVFCLFHQFQSLVPLFLQGVPSEIINDGSRVDEKLDSCFKAHLRAFHVEAMNTLGGVFYREDWKVYSLQELSEASVESSTAGNNDTIRCLYEAFSRQIRYQFESKEDTICCRSRYNEFTRPDLENLDEKWLLAGEKNPFEINECRTENSPSGSSSSLSWDDFCCNQRILPLLNTLRSYTCNEEDSAPTSKMLLKSVFDGVFPWIARLLLLIEKLPSLKKEASKVMEAIVDLYVTTAFRLCVGNRKNERVLLGIDAFGQSNVNSLNGGNSRGHRSTSPSLFDFGARGNTNQTQMVRSTPVISSTAEAELCALVLEESEGLEQLRDFMIASQKRLEGVAKLDHVDGWIPDPKIGEETIEEDFADETARVLEKRQAASCNCIFVAIGLLIATKGLASSASFASIHRYANELLEVTPLFVTLSNRISCMRAIRGKSILREIVQLGGVWEESKLHEQANDYVEQLCDFLALLWKSLYVPEARLPIGILHTLWENLLGGGYMVLLDGFSKIPFCSTEGRALMSMDVASYRSGTSPRFIAERLRDTGTSAKSCPLPTAARPYRTMAYVDTYIKLFYFPSNDALEWIRSNYKQYHQHHVISLVINDRDARKLTNQILKCYGGGEHAETIRV